MHSRLTEFLGDIVDSTCNDKRVHIISNRLGFTKHLLMMLYQRVPSDLLTETSRRGQFMSVIAMVSISILFLFETKAYFFTTILETDLAISRNDETLIQLNFDVTMMDLPCDQAAIDVYTAVGFEKKITKNIRKHPVDQDGVRHQLEARNWHQNDIELYDPAIEDEIHDLHQDGEDAISLDTKSFPYALKKYPLLFVNFYTDDCKNCQSLASTWEALGEIITDTSMKIVDDDMNEKGVEFEKYSNEEYEIAVNNAAPVLVTKVNCSLYPSICSEQDIRVYPTMRLFVDGTAKGDYNGHRTVMELVNWLQLIEAENREPGQLQIHKLSQYAYKRTIRSDKEHEWNKALIGKRSPYGLWNVTRNHPGCQLSGHILVDKAPGKFLIHAQSFGVDIAPHMANLSHIVNHFSFGDEDAQRQFKDKLLHGGTQSSGFIKSLHPMDGNVYVTKELHQAYHHHLRVVATEFGDRKVLSRGVQEQSQRVYRILQNSQLSTYRQHIVQEAKFSYDLSPIAVNYIQESRTWYDYLTGVLALVGGAFTVIGMMDRGLSSLSTKKVNCQY